MSGKKTFKVITLGESSTGKSSILNRIYGHEFNETMIPTIGMDVSRISIEVDSEEYVIAFWDTAGQEKFRTLRASYYRNVHGIMLIYDVTNEESFQKLTHWLDEIKKYATDEAIKIILIGNKTDLLGRQVTYEQGEDFARQHNMLFIETSAKTAENTSTSIFELLTKMIETRLELEEQQKIARQAQQRSQQSQHFNQDQQAPVISLSESSQEDSTSSKSSYYCC